MKRKLKILLILAFIFRVSLVFSAYHGDLNNNISWGNIASEEGLKGFYGSDDADDWPYSAPNQPPLTILLFAGLSKIWTSVDSFAWGLNNQFRLFPSKFIWTWEDKGMIFLIKLPGILADLGIAYVIFKYFQKTNEKLGLKLSALWLINPISWYNSSIWGQTDAVVNLLGLIAILFLLRKKLIHFFTVFTLSVLFKGSLAMFFPVLIFVAVKQKHQLKVWIKSALASFATVFFVSVWFHPYHDFPVWFLDLYKNRILPGEIGYLTANAFNFWWIVDPGKVLDDVLYFGIPARVLGYAFSIAFILTVIYWLKNKITDERVFASLMLVAVFVFLFMTRIHERYFYPFFPYATLLITRIPFFWFVYIIFSLVSMLNLYHLFWSPPIPFLESMYLKADFMRILAFINIAGFFVMLRLLRSSKI